MRTIFLVVLKISEHPVLAIEKFQDRSDHAIN